MVGPETSLRALPAPGTLIDRYEVVAYLAQGGMAVVLVVRRAGAGGFDRLLAMKMILPNLAGERRFVDMFLDEARIAAQVHHRNVVQVFDVGEHERVPFIVMELLRGQPLARVVRRRGLGPYETLAVLAQAAEGLAAAHATRDANGVELGVVHRDVSPRNIHVGYDGQTKVLDFGLAAAAGRIASTQSGELKGTYAYLAPEQITRAVSVDHRADIWALGVVAWEVLAGTRLFAAGDTASTLWAVLNKRVPLLAQVAPEPIDPAVSAVIASCLARNRDERPQSCSEIADVFWKAATIHGATVRAVSERMEDLFAQDKVVEDERLAAAIRTGARPIQQQDESSVTDTLPEETALDAEAAPDKPQRRTPLGRKVAISLAGVLAVASAAAWITLGPPASHPSRSRGAPSARHVPAPIPSASEQPSVSAAAPLAAAPASSAPGAVVSQPLRAAPGRARRRPARRSTDDASATPTKRLFKNPY